MTSAHKLIAVVLVWIVCGGVLTVMFATAYMTFISGPLMVVFTILFLAAAISTTYFITRSNPDFKV